MIPLPISYRVDIDSEQICRSGINYPKYAIDRMIEIANCKS